MKLPKQWKDWVRSAGLRQHCKPSRCKVDWLYLKGCGFVWRVNCFDMFQRGDRYDDFDRWALCDIDEVPLPTTKAEFLAAVDKLVAMHKD